LAQAQFKQDGIVGIGLPNGISPRKRGLAEGANRDTCRDPTPQFWKQGTHESDLVRTCP
jgi:hypothetical protein